MERAPSERTWRPAGRASRGGISGMLRRTFLTVALVTAASVCAARAQDINSVSLTNTDSNIYLTTFGSRGGRGPVNQTEADLGVGRNGTAFIWVDYDFGDRAVNEIDYSYMIGGKLLRIADPPMKMDISGSIGIQAFSFPSRKLYDRTVYCLAAEAAYEGPITADATLWHDTDDMRGIAGNFLALNLSKKLGLFDTGRGELYLVPTFKTAFGDRFLGMSGLLYEAPGAALQVSSRDGKESLELFSRFQRGAGNVKNEACFGVSVRIGE